MDSEMSPWLAGCPERSPVSPDTAAGPSLAVSHLAPWLLSPDSAAGPAMTSDICLFADWVQVRQHVPRVLPVDWGIWGHRFVRVLQPGAEPRPRSYQELCGELRMLYYSDSRCPVGGCAFDGIKLTGKDSNVVVLHKAGHAVGAVRFACHASRERFVAAVPSVVLHNSAGRGGRDPDESPGMRRCGAAVRGRPTDRSTEKGGGASWPGGLRRHARALTVPPPRTPPREPTSPTEGRSPAGKEPRRISIGGTFELHDLAAAAPAPLSLPMPTAFSTPLASARTGSPAASSTGRQQPEEAAAPSEGESDSEGEAEQRNLDSFIMDWPLSKQEKQLRLTQTFMREHHMMHRENQKLRRKTLSPRP